MDGEEAGEGGEELTELLDQVYKQTCREGRPAVSHCKAYRFKVLLRW